ncbi:MAG: adenylate/guanylate cyclase domain-containing protein [Flavobacteriales bacterium]
MLVVLMAVSTMVFAHSEADKEALENSFRQLTKQATTAKQAGNYGLSYTRLDSALSVAKELNNDELIAFAQTELGVVFMYQGNYSDALKLMLSAVLIQERLGDSIPIAESYNYIAAVHHAQSDFETAIKYYNKSLAITQGLDNPRSLAVLYNNLGSLYEDKGDYTAGLEYHQKSMTIWEELPDSSWIAVSLRHIGFCQEKQGKLDEALAVYLMSHELSSKLGTRMNVIRSSMPIGNLYLALGQPKQARKWCESAYKLSLEESNIYGIEESCWCLYRIHDGLGEAQKALDFYRLSLQARDSVFGRERTKELTEQEMRFVFEREQLADSLQYVKQEAIAERKIQTQRIGLFSVAVALLMILIIATVVYRAKRRSDHLLLNILPEKIAEELKDNGSAKATNLENVTVLFTDFKGFTELSEKLSAEELVTEIHQCFTVFDQIMEECGIEKIKTIGDAYMAAGGVPIGKASHAIDTVKAALQIQRFIINRAEERKASGKPYFEMRVGVHSGSVVAGIVGTKKFQYDIWGDTVNTAARMESSGEIGKVNVSQSTYELVKEHFKCEHRGKIAAKGKGQIDMYFVEDQTV